MTPLVRKAVFLFLVLLPARSVLVSKDKLRAEKRGLCMALSSHVCRLPLEAQLFALNTALHFADTFGYRFVGSNPDGGHDREESCPLLSSIFTVEQATLRQRPGAILPTFRLQCDPRLFVPAAKACPLVEQWDGATDKRTTKWTRNATNVWCSVPEFVEKGESERRCLPGHQSVAFMSAQKLTLKTLLGERFRPGSGADDRCSAVVELDALSLLPHHDFTSTHASLQRGFRRDIIASVAKVLL